MAAVLHPSVAWTLWAALWSYTSQRCALRMGSSAALPFVVDNVQMDRLGLVV